MNNKHFLKCFGFREFHLVSLYTRGASILPTQPQPNPPYSSPPPPPHRLLLPPADKVCKGYFLHVSVILSTGGTPTCIAGCILACLTAGLGGGVWYSSMPCRFPGPQPREKLRGLARGVSRPPPKGEVEGSGHLGLQAHTQGVLALGGVPALGGSAPRGICSQGVWRPPSP